ncbi:toxic anion resistance protein [Lysinibacillus sp. KU-BSD001]|uniref:toxic anion resistance protein n=1 Tax=Lysinibacillus sp. KU-BSD001 TaxID=3141328 RepID=UPI0036EECB55
MIQENPFDAFISSGSQLAEVAKQEYEAQLQSNSATPLFSALSPLNQKRALDLAEQLDIKNYEEIISFGKLAQQALKNFSTKLLIHVQRKDTSAIGDILFQLMEQLDQINPDALIENKKSFLGKLFNRPTASIQQTMSNYRRLSKHIERLGIKLSHAKEGLLADFAMLDELYKLNEDYFHEVNIYIAAGERKRHEIQHHILPAMQQTASTSENPMVQQELQDWYMRLEWMDRRIYDLEISREIAIQSAPQIRMIQQTHQMLIDKIQTSVMSTIPLWQSQISMLLSMNQQRRANAAQERLLKASDELMRKNAKMASITSKDIKRSGTGITHEAVDHFKETQLKLLQDLEETLRVQAVANEKRKQTESTLI